MAHKFVQGVDPGKFAALLKFDCAADIDSDFAGIIISHYHSGTAKDLHGHDRRFRQDKVIDGFGGVDKCHADAGTENAAGDTAVIGTAAVDTGKTYPVTDDIGGIKVPVDIDIKTQSTYIIGSVQNHIIDPADPGIAAFCCKNRYLLKRQGIFDKKFQN